MWKVAEVFYLMDWDLAAAAGRVWVNRLRRLSQAAAARGMAGPVAAAVLGQPAETVTIRSPLQRRLEAVVEMGQGHPRMRLAELEAGRCSLMS